MMSPGVKYDGEGTAYGPTVYVEQPHRARFLCIYGAGNRKHVLFEYFGSVIKVEARNVELARYEPGAAEVGMIVV